MKGCLICVGLGKSPCGPGEGLCCMAGLGYGDLKTQRSQMLKLREH